MLHITRALCVLLASILLTTTVSTRAQGVVVSEIMASNDRGLRDQDGEASDWIELHNSGSQSVDIGGWYLTDSSTNLDKWRFPTPTVVPAAGFLVVFASDKDRAIANAQLHTSFRLSSDGEYVGLVGADGKTVISEIRPGFPQQFVDVSYGRAFRPALTTDWTWQRTPTPGAANGAGDSVVLESTHTPLRPTTQDSIRVECTVRHPVGTISSSVSLYYRVDYQTELSTSMRDDGQGSDRVANDDVWTATIPSSVHAPGQMLRWRFLVWRTPFGFTFGPDNTNAGNSPEYYGTVIADPTVKSGLPIYQWFVRDPNAARTDQGTRCSIYYDGRFYDNVFVRRRGGTSANWSKRSYKLDFNQNHHFHYAANAEPVEELNLNTTYGDKSFVRQTLSADVFRDAGAQEFIADPVHLRQNGRFHSVAIAVEQPDSRYLARHGLDRLGALYKMFNTLDRSSSSVEKKSRHWENRSDLAALVAGLRLTGPALERFLFDNVDIPAVMSYMVANVLVHDNDNVHKNYYLYRDTRGDGEWRFLPWDKDLTFGRNFDGRSVLNDSIWASRDPQSHPLYGDRYHTKIDGFWNRLMDACHATPRIREMFLRRLRSTMDKILQSPTTARANLGLEQRLDALRALMSPDVALDRQAWGVPAWGNRSYTFAVSLDRLEREYLRVRRQHFYVTHGSAANGIIPQPQSPAASIQFGDMLASPVSGNQDEEYIELVNCNAFAVDLSGWRMEGGVRFTFDPGTVIPAKSSAWLSPDLATFRKRARSPRGGESRFVIGPYAGHLSPTETVVLKDEFGLERARRGGVAYAMTTSGNGDITVDIAGAPPGARLFTFMSVDTTSHAFGCGPFFGIGADSVWAAGVPVGTAPFHVFADARGAHRWSAGNGTLPRGLVIDSFVAVLPTQGPLRLSRVVRVRF